MENKMNRYVISIIAPKLEYSADGRPMEQPGAYDGTKTAAPLLQELGEIKAAIEELAREKMLQDVRFILYAAEAEEFKVRQVDKLISDVRAITG